MSARWGITAAMTCLMLVAPMQVRAQSSGSSGKSPPAQTPQQKLAGAKASLSRAQSLVKQAWYELTQAREQLARAQKEYDAVVAELREEDDGDPTVREAGLRVIEARNALEEQHRKALSPLRLSFRFNELDLERRRLGVELEELTRRRAHAQAQRLPFDAQDQARIGALSLQLLRLKADLSAMEDERLDGHEGYQQAGQAMDVALEEASAAMKASRQLREGNPRRQAAHKAMMEAYAYAAAKGKAYAEARRQRAQWAAQVVAAQLEADRASR